MANPIRYIGDENCLMLVADKPGIIRMTAATGADELAGTGTTSVRLINLATVTAPYYNFYNMTFDGISNPLTGSPLVIANNPNSRALVGTVAGPSRLYNCNIYASLYAVSTGWYVEDCFVLGGYMSLVTCTAFNSVLIAGSTCVGDAKGSVLSGCILIAASIGIAASSVAYNCAFIGCTIATQSSSAFNCWGVANSRVSNTTGGGNWGRLENFYSGYGGALAYTTPDVTNCYFGTTYQGNDGLTTSAGLTGWTKSPIIIFNPKIKNYLKKAFDPYLVNGLIGSGSTTTVAPATSDTLGRWKITNDIGPYYVSNITEYWTSTYYKTNPPAYFINGIGEKNIEVIASTGNMTITGAAYVWGNPTSLGAQLILEESNNYVKTPAASMTANTNTTTGSWVNLSVTASITGIYDTKLKLRLYNSEASTSASFSDIRIY